MSPEQRAEGFEVWQEPFRRAAHSQDLQPARGSVREGRLVGMDYTHCGLTHVPARAGQEYVGNNIAR